MKIGPGIKSCLNQFTFFSSSGNEIFFEFFWGIKLHNESVSLYRLFSLGKIFLGNNFYPGRCPNQKMKWSVILQLDWKLLIGLEKLDKSNIRKGSTVLLLLLWLLCMSHSGYPLWILKWVGLESSCQKLLSSKRKKK